MEVKTGGGNVERRGQALFDVEPVWIDAKRVELDHQAQSQRGDDDPSAHETGTGRREDPEDREDRGQVTRAPRGISLEKGERGNEEDEDRDRRRERKTEQFLTTPPDAEAGTTDQDCRIVEQHPRTQAE